MNIVLPAMGEGIIEATINKWLVKEGSTVKTDDPLAEVATDKVDSEVPAPSPGTILSILVPAGTVAKVGDIIAILENGSTPSEEEKKDVEKEVSRVRETILEIKNEEKEMITQSALLKSRTPSGKFISPLVRNIAAHEGIAYSELDKIQGTGMDGRITRDDIISAIKKREQGSVSVIKADNEKKQNAINISSAKATEDEIIPMDRVRKIIADHMVMSKRTSAHVTSFIDADVTKLVKWRNEVKDKFLVKEGFKLTFTPIFVDTVVKALSDFPMINVSVDGNNIIKRKNINIGMATALPDGNLIVPVIKEADGKNLRGLAKSVSDLAERARANRLKPDEITGGTFTITNFGSYDNLAGTPIINQPQVAILGTGAIRKMPAVIETEDGDMIAIRHIMILSLSYDHRIIDGALAGKFLHRIKELLENYSHDLD
jgi:2-oxoglutarate dehydrogenase E2 component (dihydrolipoamide succinyltransferase)